MTGVGTTFSMLDFVKEIEPLAPTFAGAKGLAVITPRPRLHPTHIPPNPANSAPPIAPAPPVALALASSKGSSTRACISILGSSTPNASSRTSMESTRCLSWNRTAVQLSPLAISRGSSRCMQSAAHSRGSSRCMQSAAHAAAIRRGGQTAPASTSPPPPLSLLLVSRLLSLLTFLPPTTTSPHRLPPSPPIT